MVMFIQLNELFTELNPFQFTMNGFKLMFNILNNGNRFLAYNNTFHFH
jgi:hypothetical protein